MALSNYQFQFGSFLFGAGTNYQVLNVDGIEGLPALSSQDSDRGYNDGMFSGRDFLRGRTIIFQILVLAGGGNSAQTNFNSLQDNLLVQQSGTTQMNFKLSPSDSEYIINARVRGMVTSVDPEYTFGYIKAQVTMFCPDPRYFSSTVTTATMTVQPPLGRTYNRTYNLTYGGGSLSSSTTITNAGRWTTYPTITITGPVTNPTVGNITTGQYITINYNLANTDTLVIDLDQKTVTLNGAYARNLLAGNSTWFGAPPGSSNYYFTGTNTTAGVTSATVTYRSAWV